MVVSTDIQSPTAPSPYLGKLPVYVFAWLDELKQQARLKSDVPLIDFGIGNPDQPTPTGVIEAIVEGVRNPANHGYPNFKGKPEFRQAVAHWMQQRYNVSVDPETEVQPLIGSKEGLAHLTFAYVTQGDKTIVPTPYYPVHGRASILAGGEPYFIPLLAKNNFLPDLDSIPVEVTEKAKLFFVNYPNNPTAAVADLVFYEKLVAYCKKYKIVLVSDLAYGEVGFDGYKPPSVLNVPGAKEVAVEFHSFSKTFNMAGWRCGFAVGNAGVIKNLYAMKTNMDYGLCSAIQDGAIYALTHASEFIPTVCDTYQKRRDIAVEGFKKLGWPVNTPNATMYVWLKVPSGYTSKAWTEYLLESTGVVVTPGHAFGDGGEGYFRISLVHPESLIQDALNRLTEKGIRFS